MRNKQSGLPYFINSMFKMIKFIISTAVKVISFIINTIIDELNLNLDETQSFPDYANQKARPVRKHCAASLNHTVPKDNNVNICSDCANEDQHHRSTFRVPQRVEPKNNTIQNLSHLLRTNFDTEKKFNEYKKTQNNKNTKVPLDTHSKKIQKMKPQEIVRSKNKVLSHTNDAYEEKLMQFAENINKRISSKK